VAVAIATMAWELAKAKGGREASRRRGRSSIRRDGSVWQRMQRVGSSKRRKSGGGRYRRTRRRRKELTRRRNDRSRTGSIQSCSFSSGLISSSGYTQGSSFQLFSDIAALPWVRCISLRLPPEPFHELCSGERFGRYDLGHSFIYIMTIPYTILVQF
jgi:hypothetical protein